MSYSISTLLQLQPVHTELVFESCHQYLQWSSAAEQKKKSEAVTSFLFNPVHSEWEQSPDALLGYTDINKPRAGKCIVWRLLWINKPRPLLAHEWNRLTSEIINLEHNVDQNARADLTRFSESPLRRAAVTLRVLASDQQFWCPARK